MQVGRELEAGVDVLLDLHVDVWHKLGKRKRLGERQLKQTQPSMISVKRQTIIHELRSLLKTINTHLQHQVKYTIES